MVLQAVHCLISMDALLNLESRSLKVGINLSWKEYKRTSSFFANEKTKKKHKKKTKKKLPYKDHNFSQYQSKIPQYKVFFYDK